MKTIKIAKHASGARQNSIGDDILFYSANTSRHAENIGGLFMDNPPVLSTHYASIVWRYYKDTDTYLLVHVQGSQVVNAALGRTYSFRAGYEVSREEMNLIDFNLAALFNSVPRIDSMSIGRIDSETPIDNNLIVGGSMSQVLSNHIRRAIYEGRKLYISIEIPGDSYRSDGIFNAKELDILLATIDNLPIDLRRYVGFGFCVDEHFKSIIDDIPIVIYPQDCQIEIPKDTYNLTWIQATHDDVTCTSFSQDIKLPGKNEPLWAYDELNENLKVLRKISSGDCHLNGDEWRTWIGLGHQLTELKTKSWKEFEETYSSMDKETQEEYAKTVRDSSVKWDVQDLTGEYYLLMEYSETQLETLQRKAIRNYLEKGKASRYAFLFPKGLTKSLTDQMNKNFLLGLGVDNKEDTIKWYKIFKDYNRLLPEVTNVFSELFGRFVIPGIPDDMGEIVLFMKNYPFVNPNVFKRPRRVYKHAEYKKLDKKFQEKIDEWMKEAITNNKFDNIDNVREVLERITQNNSLNDDEQILIESLKRQDEEAIYRLLVKNPDKVIEKSQLLLSTADKLPKDWRDFKTKVLCPAVEDALFNEKDDYHGPLMDYSVNNWKNLYDKVRGLGHIEEMLMSHLEGSFKTDDSGKVAEEIRKLFTTNQGGKSVPNEDGLNVLPIIDRYIVCLKKKDKNKARELKSLFHKENGVLRVIKSKKFLTGLAAGVLLSCISSLFWRLSAPSTQNLVDEDKATGFSITWSDNRPTNPMIKFADLENWDGTIKLGMDSCCYDSILLQNIDIEKLHEINMQYYQSYIDGNKVTPSVIDAYYVDEKGDSTNKEKIRKLEINDAKSLLGATYKYRLRIDSITIVTAPTPIKIGIPNKELLENEPASMSTTNVHYYFKVVKYIESQMPKDSSINIAY